MARPLFVLCLLVIGLSWGVPVRGDGERISGAHKNWEHWMQKSPLAKFQPSLQDDPTNSIEIENLISELTAKLGHRGEISLPPVMIIPSLIGSRIEAKLTNKESDHIFCDRNSDWFTLWVNAYELYPYVVECWLEDMSLSYNGTTSTYLNHPGVEIRIPDYGNVQEYLDESDKISPWQPIIDVLLLLGYEVGTSLRSAPYDWRVGPDAYENQFKALKSLIEETYTMNNNTPLAFWSLSMGGNYFLLFLNQYVNQEWKDKYVHSYTSVSGAFGGSSSATEVLVSLVPAFPGVVSPEAFRALTMPYGSIVWLMSTEQAFGDEVWVTTPSKSYSASEFHQLLIDSNATTSASILDNVQKLRKFQAPGVFMNCIYGYNISTLAQLHFPSDSFGVFAATEADGDGTVLEASLTLCSEWKSQQSQSINLVPIANMPHGSTNNAQAIRVFVQTLFKDVKRA